MKDSGKSAKEYHMQCGCGGSQAARHGSVLQSQSSDSTHAAVSALDILDERFARGEIEKVEYSEKKQLISQRAPIQKAHRGGQEPDASNSHPIPVKMATQPHARQR